MKNAQRHPPPSLEDTMIDLRKRKLIGEIIDLEKGAEGKTSEGNWLGRNVQTLTLLLAVSGAFFGAWQYFQQAKNEYKKPLWEKQLQFYLEATEASATLSAFINATDPSIKQEWNKASVKFWQLYYGQLAVVEDPNVSKSMVNFGKCLREYDFNRCDQKQLKNLSLVLAQECRNSVSKSWKEPLGDVVRGLEQ